MDGKVLLFQLPEGEREYYVILGAGGAGGTRVEAGGDEAVPPMISLDFKEPAKYLDVGGNLPHPENPALVGDMESQLVFHQPRACGCSSQSRRQADRALR